MSRDVNEPILDERVTYIHIAVDVHVFYVKIISNTTKDRAGVFMRGCFLLCRAQCIRNTVTGILAKILVRNKFEK